MTTNLLLSITPAAAEAVQELEIMDHLRSIRARIVELRRNRCHVTAAIMRDEALCQLEEWLDPDGRVRREEMQAEQGRSGAALSRMIDLNCGF